MNEIILPTQNYFVNLTNQFSNPEKNRQATEEKMARMIEDEKNKLFGNGVRYFDPPKGDN
jgi:hypothetical protein